MYNNNSNKRNAPPFIRGFFFTILLAGIVLFTGLIVMWLWNAILPNAVNANPIKYWEAVGLLILSRILFSSSWFGKRRHRHKSRKGSFWREKWMNMSDEERAKFKARWKDRCRSKFDSGHDESE